MNLVRLLMIFLVLMLVGLPTDRYVWAEGGPDSDVYGGEYDEQDEPQMGEGDFGEEDRLGGYDRGEEGGEGEEGEFREEDPYGSEDLAEPGDDTGRGAGEFEDLEEMDGPEEMPYGSEGSAEPGDDTGRGAGEFEDLEEMDGPEEMPYGSEGSAEPGDNIGGAEGDRRDDEGFEEVDDPSHGSAQEMLDTYKLPWQDDNEIELDVPTGGEPGRSAEKGRLKMLKAKFAEGEAHLKAGRYYKAMEAYKTVKKWAADLENETKRLDIIQKMNWNIAFSGEKLGLYDVAIEYYNLVLDSNPEPKLEKACYRRIEGILKKKKKKPNEKDS